MNTTETQRRVARRVIAACAAVLLPCTHAAPAQEPDKIVEQWRQRLTWVTDAKGCKVEGEPGLDRQSVRWIGVCRNGYAEGQGNIELFADDTLILSYAGGLKAGRFSGKGLLKVQGGARYEGTFLDGRMQGTGQVTYADGTTGTGNFVAEKLSGACTLTWVNGDRYQGQCRDGWPSRSGQIQFANGDAYSGAIAAGNASGQGRYIWANGDVYEGSLITGELAGVGEYRFPDGSRYTGKFVNGVPWGQGRIQRADGFAFEGEFAAGVPWGQGRIQQADGLAFEGKFAAGKPSKPGSVVHADGTPLQSTPALQEQLQMRFAKPQRLKPSWKPASDESICAQAAAPEAPKAAWAGRPEFRATVVVRDGKVLNVRVKTIKPADDESITQQMAASVEKAIRAYQCTGEGVFEQDFEFASRN